MPNPTFPVQQLTVKEQTLNSLRRIKETHTLKELQACTGVSHVTISNYLNHNRIGVVNLRKIVEWIGNG